MKGTVRQEDRDQIVLPNLNPLEKRNQSYCWTMTIVKVVLLIAIRWYVRLGLPLNKNSCLK